MRLFPLLMLIGLVLPLGGCAEGTAAPTPQTPVEVPQPRILKPEARPVTPAVPPPAVNAKPSSSPEAKVGPAKTGAPETVEVKKEMLKKELSEGTLRFQVPRPATSGEGARVPVVGRSREGGNSEPRESTSPAPAFPIGPGGPVGESAGFDRNQQYKTPTLPAGLPGWFGERDRDKDGQVGMYEWPKDQLDEFAKCDRNGDGFITPEELVRMSTAGVVASGASSGSTPTAPANSSPSPAAAASAATPLMISIDSSSRTSGGDDDRSRRFAEDTMRRYDRNNDQKLDAQELERTMSLRNNWRDHDANKDGQLDLSEITVFMKNRFSAGPNFTFGGPPPGAGRPDGERRDRGDRNERGPGGDMFGRFDQNRDGKVTENELPGFFRTRLSEWDANKDGSLDAQELSAGMENMRRSFGGPGGPPRGRP